MVDVTYSGRARSFGREDRSFDPLLVSEGQEGGLERTVAGFFYRWGGLLSSTLIGMRGRFQGDLDQYLIYLVFLLNEMSRRNSPNDRPQGDTLARGLNALSVSEITGIPRETTRRKLQMLMRARYVERAEDGLYYLGDQYGLDQFFLDLSPLFWDGLRLDSRARVGG